MKQRGAVLVFRSGSPSDKIDAALKRLVDEGLIERPPVVHEFNPEWGGPVWYVP